MAIAGRCLQFVGLKRLLEPCCTRVILAACIQDIRPPPEFDEMEYPPADQYSGNKLKVMQKVPTPPLNMKPPTRQGHGLNYKRGPEEVHNYFQHKQFGIVATQAGMLKYGHFEMIRNTINRILVQPRMFAVWRVDPPWWPVTKHTGRMGGGKGAINHYGTPIKEGRVIIEVGGKVAWEELERVMVDVAHKLPFRAIATSYDQMEAAKRRLAEQEELNLNPFTMKYIIQNNMQGCGKWLSPYDYKWFCKYR